MSQDDVASSVAYKRDEHFCLVVHERLQLVPEAQQVAESYFLVAHAEACHREQQVSVLFIFKELKEAWGIYDANVSWVCYSSRQRLFTNRLEFDAVLVPMFDFSLRGLV